MSASPAFVSWEGAVRWLREQPDQVQLVEDCYFDDPLPAAADRYWRSNEWQAVQELLAGRSGLALDVGGGRGIASYALARDGFSVTTIEPDPSALVGAEAIRSLAAETGLAIEVVEESSERLPFEDNRFNVVFARAVLHHTKSLTAACSEFHRVLKPGGILLAIREHVLSQKADLPAFLEAHPLHHLYGGENAYLLDEYMGAIEQAGFTDLRAIPYWHSAVNFAPYTLRSLQRELVSRIGLGLPGIGGFAARLVGLPAVWWGLQRVLTRLDQRPGRSYSFVASRGAA